MLAFLVFAVPLLVPAAVLFVRSIAFYLILSVGGLAFVLAGFLVGRAVVDLFAVLWCVLLAVEALLAAMFLHVESLIVA